MLLNPGLRSYIALLLNRQNQEESERLLQKEAQIDDEYQKLDREWVKFDTEKKVFERYKEQVRQEFEDEKRRFELEKSSLLREINLRERAVTKKEIASSPSRHELSRHELSPRASSPSRRRNIESGGYDFSPIADTLSDEEIEVLRNEQDINLFNEHSSYWKTLFARLQNTLRYQ
jgi:SHS2 domain-containing protein